MKNFVIFISLIILLTSCTANTTKENEVSEKLNIITTTTMLYDLVSVIVGEQGNVVGLMNYGIDPHLYKASAGDISKLELADVVVYNGYNLEGEMGEIFNSLSSQEKNVICLEDGLDTKNLILDEESIGYMYDPHIWFDVTLWSNSAEHVASSLAQIDPLNKDIYLSNLDEYKKELQELHIYVQDRVMEISENQRVLVTAHDAFSYFGNAYDFEVVGLQGISTDSEASTSDISSLATFIASNQIKAIFVESSVSSKNIEALQAAVKAQGFDVSIGGELYSDSLGDEITGHNTYIKTVIANIDTIVNALK